MAARPLPEPAESRFASYIEELHEFFATSRAPFGSPGDLPGIVDRLSQPGTFADDLNSLVRSIVLRQGGAMPHAELLEILAVAIAGPEMVRSPQYYQEPLRQLLAFVSGVMRRPWNVPPNEPGQVVPFPTEAAEEKIDGSPDPVAVAVSGQQDEQPILPKAQDPAQHISAATGGAEEPPYSQSPTKASPAPLLIAEQAPDARAPLPSQLAQHPAAYDTPSAIGAALAERHVDTASATPAAEPALHHRMRAPDSASTESPVPLRVEDRVPGRRRTLLVAVVATAAAALVVAFALRTRDHDQNGRVEQATAVATSPARQLKAPAPSVSSANGSPSSSGVSHPDMTADSSVSAGSVNPTKPSAYGRSETARRRQPPVSAWAYTPPEQPAPIQRTPPAWAYNNPSEQAAPPSQPPTATTSPQPGSASNTDAPYSPQTGGTTPAPIVRRSANTSPDAYIVGEMPPGTRYRSSPAQQPSLFAVSSGVMAANLISAPDPQYPGFARFAHIHGQVILLAVVSQDGRVSSTRVLRGNRLLTGAAQDAVRRWRYRPYRIGGRPVDVATVVTVDFHNPS